MCLFDTDATIDVVMPAKSLTSLPFSQRSFRRSGMQGM